MNSEFCAKLADIFEVDTIKEADVLRDFEAWDSLSILSIFAMAESSYGLSLKLSDLEPLITVNDLEQYLCQNRKK